MKNIKTTYTVFGHNGFLGSEFVKFLKKKKVKYLINRRNKFPKNIDKAIYFIGSDNWKNDPLQSMESNLLHLIKLLKKVRSINSFIFISSTRVYFDLEKKLVSEEDLLKINSHPNYLFNIQKLLSESILLSILKNVKIIRLSNVYGKNNKTKTLIPVLLKMQ